MNRTIKKYIPIFGILLILISMPIIFDSAFSQPTIPIHVIEKFNQQDVPPGLTRVTIIHGIDEIRKEIAHGPGVVPSLDKQESFICTDPDPDFCDTNSFDGKKWFTLPLEYFVNIKRSGDDGNFLAAVNQGVQTWEDDTGSSFDGSFLGTTNKKASLTDFMPKRDGLNVIDWGRTTHFGGGVIAVVSFLFFTASGEMVEADMRFNQDLSWCSNGGPIANPDTFVGDDTCYDVQNIATHEGGHFVAGLDDLVVIDVNDENLTMFAFSVQGEVKKRTLGLGDKLSITDAYPPGVNTPPTADAQSVTTPENTAKGITLTGTDNDGDTLTFQIDTNPTNGVLSGFTPATGTVTYTPATDFNGDDIFTFSVSDDGGTTFSTPAPVSITVTTGGNDGDKPNCPPQSKNPKC